MSRLDAIEDEKRRAKQAAKWGARMTKLRNRKKDRLLESQFCRKYGITPEVFNRCKRGENIPTQETFNKVQAGFSAEGV